METKAVIRTVSPRDVPAIVPLGRELMDFHAPRDPLFTPVADFDTVFGRFVEENIRNEAACVLVAVVDERIVGYCQAMLDRHPPAIAAADYGQILDLAVTAESRGTGVGEQMFAVLRDWFRKKGVRRIEVRHSTFNEIASTLLVEDGLLSLFVLAFPAGPRHNAAHGDK